MCVFYIPWICCECYIFCWCVLLIELNAWEDEWLVGIQALQEGKKLMKKEEFFLKKWSSLWANNQYL
jgi:hypothetical protein